jgi:hypothetical protein
MIKNEKSVAHTAVAFLQASFYLLISASPVHNRVEDFDGYMAFIAPKDSDKLWDKANLQLWGVTEDDCPYDLPNDHPAAVLKLTRRAVKSFITSEAADIPKSVSGGYLAQVWERCLLRRTYSS